MCVCVSDLCGYSRAVVAAHVSVALILEAAQELALPVGAAAHQLQAGRGDVHGRGRAGGGLGWTQREKTNTEEKGGKGETN